MDEQKLAELFRDAVLVVAGIALAAFLPRSGEDTAAVGSAQDGLSPTVTTFGAPPEPEFAPNEASPDRSGGLPPRSIPVDPPTQGGEPPGSAGRPTAGGTPPGCVEVDRELAVALADELPVARGLNAAPAAAQCPPGARGVSYLLRDGDVHGTVSVVLTPPGELPPSFGEATRSETAITSGGGELHVLSRPAEGASAVPFADELPGLAQRLAERF